MTQAVKESSDFFERGQPRLKENKEATNSQHTKKRREVKYSKGIVTLQEDKGQEVSWEN